MKPPTALILHGVKLSGPTFAGYAYLAHASEGGISLSPYAALRAWLACVKALPEFVPMPTSARPAAS